VRERRNGGNGEYGPDLAAGRVQEGGANTVTSTKDWHVGKEYPALWNECTVPRTNFEGGDWRREGGEIPAEKGERWTNLPGGERDDYRAGVFCRDYIFPHI
jgi:hypothetical protein